MSSGTSNRSLISQVLHDPLVWLFALIYTVSCIPYLISSFSFEQLTTYSWFVATFFLLPFSIMVLWPRASEVPKGSERSFWRALAAAFCFQWLISLVNLLGLTNSFGLANFSTASVDVVTTLIFLGFYVSWLIALSFAPHTKYIRSLELHDKRLLAAGAAITALSMFLYFILIPSRVTPDVFEHWVLSLLFFASLDIILLALLGILTFRAANYRWRVIYCVMMVNAVLFVLLDLLEAMDYSEHYQWLDSASSTLLWTVPYFLIVISARMRSYNFGRYETSVEQSERSKQNPISPVSPIILASFILPVLHIGLDLFDRIPPELRQARSTAVLASLIIIWTLAYFENRSLRQTARAARIQAEELEDLRIQQAVTEQSEQAKARFLANVSHEIRTPMNGILGMSEILLRNNLNKEQWQQAELVKSSAEGLLGIIDDILEYSKFETGELSFVEKPFDLRDVAEHVVDLFRVSGKQKNIDLTLDIDESIPRELQGDGSRLRQVLLNLVSNAVKFTSEGEIRVEFSTGESSHEKMKLSCKVSDSGIGVHENELDQIFLPFTQGDESTSRKFGGSGLGLAISKQIIEAQSGTIGVYNNPDKGATFWFELPVGIAPVQPGPAEQENDAVAVQKISKRILVAEDDVVNQIVAVKQLEALGITADVANNGHEVLEALERRSYALILMDCQMPGLDGFQATRKIREKGYSKSDLPIIALTAHVLEEDKKRCFEAGMNDVLSKPILLEKLRTSLESWTIKKRQPRKPTQTGSPRPSS